MQNTNPTTNVLQEYAPFDSGYEFAYWSKRLNVLDTFDPEYFHYVKSIFVGPYYVQIGRPTMLHMEYVKSRHKDATMQAVTLLILVSRVEGEKVTYDFFNLMPLSIFNKFCEELL